MPNCTPKLRLPAVVLLTAAVACAQTGVNPDLAAAYQALSGKDYDHAITAFRKGLAAQPANAGAHKDLAYTLLKTGDNAEARDEFEAALKLNSADETAALEFAFLAYETGRPADARRTFNRLRLSKNPKTRDTAEAAYQNIDRPLVDGIARWTEALRRAPAPDTLAFYSAHWELAQLAEKRDEWTLAAAQYEICHRLKPADGDAMLALAQAWKHTDRAREANAALLAASRWPNTRTAERAREEFGPRYPYPYEFVDALKLDSKNAALRKELAFLYLAMHKEDEAKEQFRELLAQDPNNKEAREQLDAIEVAHTGLKTRDATPSPHADAKPSAKEMGLKSLALGYSQDAIRYLRQAHENDPDDAEVTLRLGYAYNYAKDDADALKWFDLARHSEDAAIAGEARKAFRNLHGDTLPQTTIWTLPMYSTRWHDLFSYGQIKRTLPLPWTIPHHWFSLYLSTRFLGDLRSGMGSSSAPPTYLSESSIIVGVGVATKTWHHLTGWAEAGEAIKYLPSRHDVGAAIPDYRGGVNFARSFGTILDSTKSGWFTETTADAIYVHRFDKDWILNVQNRAGWTLHFAGVGAQALLNVNAQRDWKGEPWANILETGPGVRLHLPMMPQRLSLSGDYLRGFYTNGSYIRSLPGGQWSTPIDRYHDVRVGLWYALSK